MDHQENDSPWTIIRMLAVALCFAASAGCFGNKHHRGRNAPGEVGQAAMTNALSNSVAMEVRKSARTNAAPGAPAGSTSQNKTEAQGDTLTPMDQGEGPQDRKITQNLRRSIVSGQGGRHFSFLAKNVKIITVNGLVTLRGVVNTAAEKSQIDALARQIRGVSKVNNELVVKGGS